MNTTMFLVVLAVVLAVCSAADFQVMGEAKLARRRDLSQGARASPSQTHEVVFSVKRRNLDKLKSIVDGVSYPSSPSYGQYLSRSELAELTTDPVATGLVVEYLKSHPEINIVKQTRFGEFVTASAPISTWEAMFDTTFFEINRVDSKGQSVAPVSRALKYSVPSVLAPHLFAVLNTVQMPPRLKARKMSRKKLEVPNANPSIIEFGSVTPALINQFCE